MRSFLLRQSSGSDIITTIYKNPKYLLNKDIEVDK